MTGGVLELGVKFFGVLALAIVLFYLRVDEPAPEHDTRPPEERDETTWWFSYFGGLVVSIAAFGPVGVVFPVVFRVVLAVLERDTPAPGDTDTPA